MKLCISLKSLSTGSFPPYLSTPCFERLQRDTPLKKNAFLLFLDHLVLKNKHHFNEIPIPDLKQELKQNNIEVRL